MLFWNGQDLELKVRIQPKACRDEIVGPQKGEIKIRITAPPVEGKANAHLIRFLAKQFDIPPSRVTLLNGEKGRSKRLRIEAPSRIPESLTGLSQGES